MFWRWRLLARCRGDTEDSGWWSSESDATTRSSSSNGTQVKRGPQFLQEQKLVTVVEQSEKADQLLFVVVVGSEPVVSTGVVRDATVIIS